MKRDSKSSDPPAVVGGRRAWNLTWNLLQLLQPRHWFWQENADPKHWPPRTESGPAEREKFSRQPTRPCGSNSGLVARQHGPGSTRRDFAPETPFAGCWLLWIETGTRHPMRLQSPQQGDTDQLTFVSAGFGAQFSSVPDQPVVHQNKPLHSFRPESPEKLKFGRWSPLAASGADERWCQVRASGTCQKRTLSAHHIGDHRWRRRHRFRQSMQRPDFDDCSPTRCVWTNFDAGRSGRTVLSTSARGWSSRPESCPIRFQTRLAVWVWWFIG